jgi:hypothetical protein
VLHENFHATYQIFGQNKFGVDKGHLPSRAFFATCVQNGDWNKSMIAELADWSTITAHGFNWKNPLVRAAVISIFARRRASTNADVNTCWDLMRIWERIEGAAYYVETLGALGAGLIDATALQVEYKTRYLDLRPLNANLFYGTGSWFLRVSDSIAPNHSWQSFVEQGLTPEQVLRALVGNTGS